MWSVNQIKKFEAKTIENPNDILSECIVSNNNLPEKKRNYSPTLTNRAAVVGEIIDKTRISELFFESVSKGGKKDI